MAKSLSSLVLSTFAFSMLGACSSEIPSYLFDPEITYVQTQGQCDDDDDDFSLPNSSSNLVVQFQFGVELPDPDPITIPSVPQLDKPSSCEKRDILFLLDVSGSMDGDIAQARAEADKIMLNTLDTSPDSRFGLALFGGATEAYTLLQPLTENYLLLDGILQSVRETNGDTERSDYALASALQLSVGWRVDAHRLILLYTDEHPQISKGVADVANESHASIYAVVRGYEQDWSTILFEPHSVVSLGLSEDFMRVTDEAIHDSCKGLVWVEPSNYFDRNFLGLGYDSGS